MPENNSPGQQAEAAADFFRQPILNSPYEEPSRHWELDESGQPTQKILNFRRPADFISPIPAPAKKRQQPTQGLLQTDKKAAAISDSEQEYHKAIINEIRNHVREWRKLPRKSWKVTPVTSRLLEHWRKHEFGGIRPFFCQLEAIETIIWLTEVAPQSKRLKEKYLDYLDEASLAANPGLSRLALKMATGSGKTTVMAMLIAWQTLNVVRGRKKDDERFSRAFLIVAPGITIRDRLRVLLPNSPDSCYAARELVPADMLADLNKARIVITTYHAFQLREKMGLSRAARLALEGWRGKTPQSLETEGEMLARIMPEFSGMKNIIVINDEAHHCYREKPDAAKKLASELNGLEKEEKRLAREEAKARGEAARLWISGLEAAQKRFGIARVFDLTATPFFLAGSGYREGTLFPWTMSDFSLMDAIECGIVKLPRVPVADNIPGAQVPMFRKLWEHIRQDMPRKGGKKAAGPLALPVPLQTALDALYGHYEKLFELWQDEGVSVPPCFIIVCNDTAASRAVYDYIAGSRQTLANGGERFEQGRLPLFRNFDNNGEPLPKPRTLLIDSAQLESGEKLGEEFMHAAREEIDNFRRAILLRGGKEAADLRAGRELSEAAILREAMNTVGKKDKLGGNIRCVVSVGMLTEGWDASTVTHILGVRAFGSQLLCEQVIGRALRRQCYELNENALFDVEYADILGIPFDFAAKPVIAEPRMPKEMTHVHAVSPERDCLEIRFPRVLGYRLEPPGETLGASFSEESRLLLTQELTGATDTRNAGIIGESVDLTVKHLDHARRNSLAMRLTRRLLEKFTDEDDLPKLHLYGQLKVITEKWLDECLICQGGTQPAQLLYPALLERACEKIYDAIARHFGDSKPIRVILDDNMPEGSSSLVNFSTSKRDLWKTDSRKCQLNYIVADKSWEQEFCRVAEKNDNHVLAYVKNYRLGLEVPYSMAGQARIYEPDFILLVDAGQDKPARLVVEIKGFRGEDAALKKAAMENFWIPGVNSDGRFGNWAFIEIRDFNAIEPALEKAIEMLRNGENPTGMNFSLLQASSGSAGTGRAETS